MEVATLVQGVALGHLCLCLCLCLCLDSACFARASIRAHGMPLVRSSTRGLALYTRALKVQKSSDLAVFRWMASLLW